MAGFASTVEAIVELTEATLADPSQFGPDVVAMTPDQVAEQAVRTIWAQFGRLTPSEQDLARSWVNGMARRVVYNEAVSDRFLCDYLDGMVV